MAPYRLPGRSNRSGRTQADNDIFEGLPVKQWTHVPARVSLAPPVSETQPEKGQDRWGEPPMPRDFHLLQPWTQQLLRLARSGKVGQKRKSVREVVDGRGEDYNGRDDDTNNHNDESSALAKSGFLDEERAFVAKKWKHVPEHSLVPEHLHWEFLAKRRKGLQSFYYGLNDGIILPVALRKTKVSKVIDPVTGEVAVYTVLAPEGQSIENEIVEGSELADREPVVVVAGTTVEGVGVANDEGILVMEVRNAAALAQRRNRPPPKKKGGPGRGKKRVTFTNPDGSTYTTIVPNATKIVPQPGQTVKHVAKGEEAARDITTEEAARLTKTETDGEDDGDDDEDDEEEEEGDEGDEDGDGDGRVEGEVVEEDATAPEAAEAVPDFDDNKGSVEADQHNVPLEGEPTTAMSVDPGPEDEVGNELENEHEPEIVEANAEDIIETTVATEPEEGTIDQAVEVAMPDADTVTLPHADLARISADDAAVQEQEAEPAVDLPTNQDSTTTTTQEPLPSVEQPTDTTESEQAFALPGIVLPPAESAGDEEQDAPEP